MIIATDIDDVINDLGVKTAELFNQRFNKSLTIEDFTSFDFCEWLSKEDSDNIKSLFKEKELWDSLKPTPGSKAALQKIINRGHKVIFATATDPINFGWKIDWMKNWFSFINSDNIIRIMDKSLLKVDVLIDDNLDNLTQTFAERICFDMPWNQQSELTDEVYGIKRCHNWNEIIDAINKIEREIKKYE